MATILFDLDGTLLPMDQSKFVKTYFGLLAKRMTDYGYQPEQLLGAFGKGTHAMIKNDGSMSNEHRFWASFEGDMGVKTEQDRAAFEAFYANDFSQVKSVCGFHPGAAEIISLLKAGGHRLILATNPLFPRIATHQRIQWAGLQPEDFELFTTFEDYHYCKPSQEYYMEIMEKIGEKPENCIMIGNDVGDDMVAADLGMRVFLLTDCLINEAGADTAAYPQGNFDDLKAFLEEALA